MQNACTINDLRLTSAKKLVDMYQLCALLCCHIPMHGPFLFLSDSIAPFLYCERLVWSEV